MTAAQPVLRSRLQLEPSTHTYRLDGQVIPGVTSVLKGVGIIDYSFIPQDVLQEASRRGTAVHVALQHYDEGTFDRGSFNPEWLGYIDAYERFLEQSRFQPAQIEQKIYHPLHRYAGTLDRTGLLDDDLVILDFKTGLVLPGHALQLAGYLNCLPGPRRFRRMALQLCANATYRIHEYPGSDLRLHVEVFLSALACHTFKGVK